MKLHRVHLIDGEALGILQGFHHTFASQVDDELEPLCFIGANGTGKSRMLQCLAEIFHWLDARTRPFRPDPNAIIGFRFELEYVITDSSGNRHIIIRNVNDQRKPEVYTLVGKGEISLTENEDIRTILPCFIVGYTSGENETLSVPFLDVKAEYAAEVRERALLRKWISDDIPDLRLVMMDYHSNLSILVANFLLQPADRLAFFKDYIRVNDLESFRIVIQTNHKAARKTVTVKIEDEHGRIREESRQGVQLVPQLETYISQLCKSSTCFTYDQTNSRWTFDFFVNDATREAFKYFFDNAYKLCMALDRLAMLNELIVSKQHRTQINTLRRTQKVVVKPPIPAEEDKVFRFQTVRLKLDGSEDATDYISLSDGEHQFIHIFGTLLMFEQSNVLFLLDEAESHFNPHWRIKFVPLLNQIATGKHQAVLLTSHAPFVISDSKSENVYIFKRTDDGQHVVVSQPESETYGASFDRLLEDVFHIRPPISRKSLGDLRTLQKTGTKEEIKEKLEDFGDSSEKFYLFQRLAELKEKKS